MDDLYICNIVDKRSHEGLSDHCTNNCGHGKWHKNLDRVFGSRYCTGVEECCLHKSGRPAKVKCRPIRKKNWRY